ncbi:MAG TPA: CehA/McbA family metallohydrolase [Sedimentisphaerales bacterium]|nr:CehA/McbA family metallohydrolase [Sedimentisphaerales bacterium]
MHILKTAITIVTTLIVPCLAQSQSAMLSVTVHEPNDSASVPCRAWVTAAGQQLYKPLTKSCTPYEKDQSFSCDGYFVMTVPPGEITIHLERGKEYLPLEKAVFVKPNQTTHVELTLERWINMAQRGWYSCDIHCHFGVDNLTILRQSALADDINFQPVLTFWNHQKNIWTRGVTRPDTWPQWPLGPAFYADAEHLITLRNQEIERIGGQPFESLGALHLLGLADPLEVPPAKSPYPCDATLGQKAKDTSPHCVIDTDKPIWAQNVVGVALGLFDSVQLCHNHYHRNATLSICCGMVRIDPGLQGDPDELFHSTNLAYYRFLNCGFKLAATGGTAMGVMPAPLGYNRTYAKLAGPLTEANYLQAIRAGRTFATSGPMLILTVNGLDTGSTIEYSTKKPQPVAAKAQLHSIQPVDSLEVIHNGKVVKTISLKDKIPSPILEQQIDFSLTPQHSGWLAARAIFTAPDGRLRQAHSSPVYILVDDKPIAFKQDAEYMIDWIDKLIEVNRRKTGYKSQTQRDEVEAIFRKPKNIYETIAQSAAEQ